MQSAYERWEIGSLSKDLTDFKSKLNQEIIIARDEGYQKGLEEERAAGLESGLAKGYAQALEEGREQNKIQSQQFSALCTSFELELQQAKEHTAQQILELCLDMSQLMVIKALKVNPELLIPIIEQALENLPVVQLPATLYLNANDLELVQLSIGVNLKQEGWRLISDKHIEAGGCRLETAINQIDATLPSRWQQLLDALGKSGEWLTS
jgi:flagellar assembly protein FliH